MKKKYLLLLLLLIPFQVHGATINNNNSYTAKCKSYNVDVSSDTSVLDYFYYTYFYSYENKSTSDFTLVRTGTNRYSFFIYDNSLSIPLDSNRYVGVLPNCIYNGNTGNFTCASSLTQNSFPLPNSSVVYLYSSKTLTYGNSSTLLINSNITASDIENRYEDFCNTPVVNVDSPIDKNEFYVLLGLIAVILFMIFFHWCFPNKGGKNL